VICAYFKLCNLYKEQVMKKTYHLPLLSYKEQVMYYYILLEEIEKQKWCFAFINPLSEVEEFVSMQ
jgi:hypothetical protein